MPRKDRRSSAARRRRSAKSRPKLSEYFTFSVKAGASQNVLKNVLSVPKGRDFRPLSFKVETLAWLPYASMPGSICPGAVQLQLYDPQGNSVAVSRVSVTGSVPRTVSVAYPRSGDWFPSGAEGNAILGVISADCIANMGGDHYVRGVGYFTYELSKEVVSATCPVAHLCDTDPSSEPSTSTSTRCEPELSDCITALKL